MYLEISPRQTGKTTRMLYHIKCCEHKKPLIIATSLNQAKNIEYLIRKLFPSDIDGLIVTSIGAFNNVLNKLEQSLDYRFFFDDFDFMKLNKFPCMSDTRLLNSYFCTTPSRVRNLTDFSKEGEDILIDLLKLNKFNYTCYSNINREWVGDHIKYIRGANELFGTFVK